MSTLFTHINDLAAESLAHIFAFLSPDERVRMERVCRQWRQVAKKYVWTDTKKLTLDWRGLEERVDMALAKYRTLIDRCAPHLRELSFALSWEFNTEHWAKMRNLRHLRFDSCVPSNMLRAVTNNLTRLHSLHFSNMDWRSVAGLRELLRMNNSSLQALRIPVDDPDSLHLPALPSSLRSLHINDNNCVLLEEWKRDRINELLELAVTCCPQLSILMLPVNLFVGTRALRKLSGFGNFDRLFYLRLHNPSDANLPAFADTLAIIGAQLRALLLESVNSRVLQLITKHCPSLEHCSFYINLFSSQAAEGIEPALQSVFRLPHLRSISIRANNNYSEQTRTQIMAALNDGLRAKGNIEYLHLSCHLPLTAKFIIDFIHLNPNLRKLSCAIQHNPPAAELSTLNTLLQNILNKDRPVDLELFGNCPPGLEMWEDSRVRVRTKGNPESISQPMLREFYARAMHSVPDLGNLDD